MKSRTEASLSPNEHFSSSTADSNNFVQRLPGSGGWLWNYIGAYTLQILFVRYGRDNLDNEIEAIFGVDDKNDDGSEKEITYGEYVEKINKRALKE